MNTLRLTVYEILGYFAPGVVALAALAVFVWALFAPGMPAQVVSGTGKVTLFGFAFMAYSLGHFVQGISNLHPSPEDRAEKGDTLPHLVSAARQNLSTQCKGLLEKHSIRDLVELAQASVTNSGKTDTYDVLVYREGFYRGSTTAYILLSFSLLLRASMKPTLVRTPAHTYTVAEAAVLLAALLSGCIAFVYYRRYIRFSDHRVRYLLNVASLSATNKEEDEPKNQNRSGSENTTTEED